MGLMDNFRMWTGCGAGCHVVFVTDRAQRGLADAIMSGGGLQAEVIQYQEDFAADLERLRALGAEDLVVAALSLDSFITQRANRFFSPFGKPEGVAAKYVFLRLDITAASLAQGLATPPELVYGKIAEMAQYEDNAALRVRSAAGVELGQGLSNMDSTGLIGVDESILSSCHFGFGDGGTCGTHLDMVLTGPKIERIGEK